MSKQGRTLTNVTTGKTIQDVSKRDLLIAAAPELLSVLKAIAEFAKTGQPLHWGALITDSDDETAAETVLKAIATAEGRKE